jgi:hypothetical protein
MQIEDRVTSGTGMPDGPQRSERVSPEAADVLTWLIPDLKTTLASLDGAPAPVATSVVQLLPFALRAVLVERGLARPPATGAPCAVAELTPLAYHVMRAAAIEASADPTAVTDWLRRAEEAARPSA